MRTLVIAKGTSRRDLKWKNTNVTWEKLKNKLSNTTRTPETMKEYLALSKAKQDDIKDIGGFVGGELKNGKRGKGFVNYRDLLTLDLDSVSVDISTILYDFDIAFSFTYCVYSTHKHTSTSPRLRLIVPLSRSVKPDEYEAIARYVASLIGIDYFDDTTFQAERLMYWPSTSLDADFVYEDGSSSEWLDVEYVLKNKYHDWTDINSWSYSSRVNADSIKRSAEKQEDPKSKDGIIGAFCNLYTIQEVIANYLSDVYTPTEDDNRYTYTKGSTSGGAVVYNDTFLYSHHSTDPCSMRLVNAYDLLRIHKFGHLDEGVDKTTRIDRYPSFKAINEFLSEVPEIKKALVKNNIEAKKEVIKEFENIEGDDAWLDKLSVYNNKTGELESSINNFVLILENDPKLKNLGRKNLFRERFEINKAPWVRIDYPFWTDADDSALRHYIEVNYGIEGRVKLDDAFNIYSSEHNYHPIKEYLESLKWDGVKRAENLLIKYLSADDNVYVKEVTIKTLVAAVKRIYVPGCKFDQMLTLVGPQGIGKSLLFKKLGKEWFSDTLSDIRGKEAYEALEGVWIMEMGELAAAKKQDRDTIKSFISKQVDTYRKAYARNVTDNLRTCIFIGTTNDNDFLNDPTGSRRFWPVDCRDSYKTREEELMPTVWDDFTPEEVDQVWAEVMLMYKTTDIADRLMSLSYEARMIYDKYVDNHTYVSDNVGIIDKYLEILLPETWDSKSPDERRDFIQSIMNGEELVEAGVRARDRVTIPEIKNELGKLISSNSDFMLAREIADHLNNLEDWEGVSTIRTKHYGRQRGWRKV